VTRQRFRRAVLVISSVLIPITLFYLSPYVILMAASEGIVSGSCIVFGGLLVSSLVLGRAFCGWVCPAGGIGEFASRLRDKQKRYRRANGIKYGIWLPWLGLIAYFSASAGGLRKVQFGYQTWHGISVSSWNGLVILLVILLLLVGLSVIVGRRGFCHTMCWMAPFMILGRTIRDRMRFVGLRLTGDAEACIECGQCTRHCPMSLDVQAMVARGAMSDSECILCANCADTCPKDAIGLRFTRADPHQ